MGRVRDMVVTKAVVMDRVKDTEGVKEAAMDRVKEEGMGRVKEAAMGNKEVAEGMAVVSKGDPMEEGVRVTSGLAEVMGRRGEGVMVAIEKLYINNCRVNINKYIVTRVAKNAPNVLLKITQMLAYIFCVIKRKSEEHKSSEDDCLYDAQVSQLQKV